MRRFNMIDEDGAVQGHGVQWDERRFSFRMGDDEDPITIVLDRGGALPTVNGRCIQWVDDLPRFGVPHEFGSLEIHVPGGVDLNDFTEGEPRYIPDPDEAPLPDGHRRYHFDMIGAHLAGEDRHPETVIREIASKAHSFQPESIGDCWFFSAPVIERLPSYVREVGA